MEGMGKKGGWKKKGGCWEEKEERRCGVGREGRGSVVLGKVGGWKIRGAVREEDEGSWC